MFFTMFPYAVGDVGPVTHRLDHFGNNFGWILQVAIQNRHHLAACFTQSGGKGGLMAKVSSQTDGNDTLVSLDEFSKHHVGLIRAAVVDKDDFLGRLIKPVKHFADTCVAVLNRFLLVIDRDDTRDGGFFIHASSTDTLSSQQANALQLMPARP